MFIAVGEGLAPPGPELKQKIPTCFTQSEDKQIHQSKYSKVFEGVREGGLFLKKSPLAKNTP